MTTEHKVLIRWERVAFWKCPNCSTDHELGCDVIIGDDELVVCSGCLDDFIIIDGVDRSEVQ